MLAADDRIEPVMAILDESVLTIDDFTASSDDGDISKYVASLIKEFALRSVNPPTPSFPPLPDTTTILEPNDYLLQFCSDTVEVLMKNPMLKTKWNQGYPYNSCCPIENGTHCLAGCAPVAVSQIIASNEYPDNLVSDGESFDWNLIKQNYYGQTPTSQGIEEMARLIYNIGRRMETDYGLEASSTYTSKLHKGFDHIYNDVALWDYSSQAGRIMMMADRPLCIRGDGNSGGHAWVIDGWNEYNVRTWELHLSPVHKVGRDPIVLDSIYLQTYNNKKVHCNFGWGGRCDGYYTDNIFDTTQIREDEDLDTSIGDIPNSGGYIYSSGFKMIYYTFGSTN